MYLNAILRYMYYAEYFILAIFFKFIILLCTHLQLFDNFSYLLLYRLHASSEVFKSINFIWGFGQASFCLPNKKYVLNYRNVCIKREMSQKWTMTLY